MAGFWRPPPGGARGQLPPPAPPSLRHWAYAISLMKHRRGEQEYSLYGGPLCYIFLLIGGQGGLFLHRGHGRPQKLSLGVQAKKCPHHRERVAKMPPHMIVKRPHPPPPPPPNEKSLTYEEPGGRRLTLSPPCGRPCIRAFFVLKVMGGPLLRLPPPPTKICDYQFIHSIHPI